jgi:hypothetical protein
MQISYRAWANKDKEQSVSHPDWPKELGGIQHLPEKQQQEIEAQV